MDAILNIIAPPIISSSPNDKNVAVGANATFAVVVPGSGLGYQWQKDEANIAGATSASYAITAAKSSDAGDYRCVVTNAQGSTLSDSARLTIQEPPTITLHPADSNSTAPSRITFAVAAEGPGNQTYQWQKNGVDIPGATGIRIVEHLLPYDSNRRKWFLDSNNRLCYLNQQGTLFHNRTRYDFNASCWADPSILIGPNYFSLNISSNSDAGTYRCSVTGTYGSATSNGAILSISAPPYITVHPANQNVSIGTNATLSVTASGVGLDYQWRKNGVNIAGATGSSHSITNVQAGDAGLYDCVVSNPHGAVVSNGGELTAMVPPTIIEHPADINATSLNVVTFKVSASGPGPLTYQWQKDGTNIAGGNGYTITTHLKQYDRASRKWLKDSSGTWCYINPQGILVRRGTRTTLGVAYWNDPSLLIGPNFFVLNNVSGADAGTYRCVITNPSGSVTSNGAILTAD